MEDLPEPPGVLAGYTYEERIDEFFRLLAEGNYARTAASAVSIHPTTLYRKRREDPAFAKRWEDAQRICIESIESALYKRALKNSDKAAELLLKALAPEKYRERSEVRHAGGVTINVNTGIPTSDVDDML